MANKQTENKNKVSNIWITSDTHWGHSNIIRYCNRPFLTSGDTPDVDAMDHALLSNWREVVKAEDTIIHLGDVCFKWSKERTQSTLQNLPGYKILIMGNHDRHRPPAYWREVGFDEVYPYPIIYKEWYILSHEEVFINDNMPYINLHGHRHGANLDKPYYINVCVENTGYKPVLLSSLLPPSPELDEKDNWIPSDRTYNKE
jgi:calcineurin-like phosphoesterase family protein